MHQGHACLTVAEGKPVKQFDQHVGKHNTSEQKSQTAGVSPKVKSFICTAAAVIVRYCCSAV